MQNRFGDRRQITSVSVWRGVADVPEFSRDELIDGNSGLDYSLVAKERVLIVTDHVPLQIRKSSDDCAAGSVSLQPWFGNVASQIKRIRRSHILNSQVSGRIERVRLTEEHAVQIH